MVRPQQSASRPATCPAGTGRGGMNIALSRYFIDAVRQRPRQFLSQGHRKPPEPAVRPVCIAPGSLPSSPNGVADIQITWSQRLRHLPKWVPRYQNPIDRDCRSAEANATTVSSLGAFPTPTATPGGNVTGKGVRKPSRKQTLGISQYMAPIDASEQELSTASIADKVQDTASMKSRRPEYVLMLAKMRDFGFGQTFRPRATSQLCCWRAV